MAVEMILWFVGCGLFLLVLLFVVRPYVLQHHDDEEELETSDEPRKTESDSVNPPS